MGRVQTSCLISVDPQAGLCAHSHYSTFGQEVLASETSSTPSPCQGLCLHSHRDRLGSADQS